MFSSFLVPDGQDEDQDRCFEIPASDNLLFTSRKTALSVCTSLQKFNRNSEMVENNTFAPHKTDYQ